MWSMFRGRGGQGPEPGDEEFRGVLGGVLGDVLGEEPEPELEPEPEPEIEPIIVLGNIIPNISDQDYNINDPQDNILMAEPVVDQEDNVNVRDRARARINRMSNQGVDVASELPEVSSVQVPRLRRVSELESRMGPRTRKNKTKEKNKKIDPELDPEIMEDIEKHLIDISKARDFKFLSLKIIRDRLSEKIGKDMTPYKKYIKSIVIKLIVSDPIQFPPGVYASMKRKKPKNTKKRKKPKNTKKKKKPKNTKKKNKPKNTKKHKKNKRKATKRRNNFLSKFINLI